MLTMASSAYRGSRYIVVALHSRGFPSDAEWEEYMAFVRESVSMHGGPGRSAFGIAITDGGAPTARQRAQLVEALHGERAVGAVVTSSRLALGIGRALSWIHPEIKTFAPRDFHRALKHVALPETEWPTLLDHLDRQRARLHVEALAEIDAKRLVAAK